MLVGIGIDIVKIARMQSLIESARVCRVFVESEIQNAPIGCTRLAYFAKRFAAKEACAKALGTGFSNYLSHTDIVVYKNTLGQPHIELSTQSLSHFRRFYDSDICMHLSLSDEKEYAIAFVTVSTK